MKKFINKIQKTKLNSAIADTTSNQRGVILFTRSKLKFVALLVGIFLIGYTQIFAQTFNGGNGSQIAPWRISNIANIMELNDWVSGIAPATGGVPFDFAGQFFVLTNDIGTPIPVTTVIGGNAANNIINIAAGAFAGNFNGNGFTITLLLNSFNANLGMGVALFNAVTKNGIIRNLNVNGRVKGGFAAGIASSLLDNATIDNCVNNCYIECGTALAAGGIVSNVVSGSPRILNSKNSGRIVGFAESHAGGIVGIIRNKSNNTLISNNTNIGNVTGGFSGGICSHSDAPSVFCSNLNGGVVEGSATVGGIIGAAISGNILTNCISTTPIINYNYIPPGAVIGTTYDYFGMPNLTITNCFYDSLMFTGNGIGAIQTPWITITTVPNVLGSIEGLTTFDMIFNALASRLPTGVWIFEQELYPRLDNHPVSYLAASPIHLSVNSATGMFDNVNDITQNFYIPHRNGVSWRSEYLIVDINPMTGIATISVGSNDSDTLIAILGIFEKKLYPLFVP